MREKKFTKGPWTLMNQGAIWLIYGADEVVTRVAKIFITLNRGDRKANAALISAAPELLEALEHCARELQAAIVSHNATGNNMIDNPADSQTVHEADRAIAKAYGEVE